MLNFCVRCDAKMKKDREEAFTPLEILRPVKDKSLTGFTLLELLIGICILIIIGAVGFTLIWQASQRTKVVVAKVSLTQFSMLLESVKSDANYYPPAVNDTLESLAYTAAPAGYERGWRGPYLKATPIDPWKKKYFYRLVYGVIFGPMLCPRVAGPPSDETYYFDAVPGEATLIMYNDCKIDHSGEVWLNGTSIITPDEFKNDVPVVEKQVILLAKNSLRMRLTSGPGTYIIMSIKSSFSNRTGYVIGSYGYDNKAGGTGFAKDLTWETGQSGADF